MRSLAALADAEALESEILGALAAADIVAGPEVQACIKELHSAFQALQPNPSIEVVDLPWPAFSRVAKPSAQHLTRRSITGAPTWARVRTGSGLLLALEAGELPQRQRRDTGRRLHAPHRTFARLLPQQVQA